jgi:8-oxo-dGTP diphosphatase
MWKKKEVYVYEWPRPAVTVDMVLFTVVGALQELRLQALLIRRDTEPYRGSWALPGGFVRENEDLPVAAARELAEETGITGTYLEQVDSVGTPGRDPRGHVITIVWMALVAGDRHRLQASGDAAAACWFDVTGHDPLPPLAFDHAELLQHALTHLRRRVLEAPLIFELLPAKFALSELQALYEAILGRELDRRNFRRKVKQLQFLELVKGTRREGAHRPAQLYQFNLEAFGRHMARARLLPF